MSVITISDAFANAAHEGRRAFLDSGAGVARVLVYTAPQPASGAAPAGATLLLSAELAKPSSAIANGAMSLVPGEDALVLATGDAAWARVINGNGDFAFDCDVSDLAGNGIVKLPSVTLYEGGTVRIASGVFT